MARTVLLDTRTATYLDLVGNGKRFRVPAYQRDYSWEEEQWEDLWNDIVELRNIPDDRHYMGALVLQGLSDREFSIIDGQQRLATLSIIALAVIGRLLELAEAGVETAENRERAMSLRSRFIGEKDPASLIESSKLFLNDSDNAFYQDYLVQLRAPINPRGLPKSNRLLWECSKWFSARLGEGAEAGNGQALASFLSETMARQLLFIQINVDDVLDAYTVFETLNARGLELSATDLIKNYIFSRIRVQADLEALQRRWKALIGTVRQERFPEFLRYHLLCEQSRIRSQRLFKIIRDRVKTPPEVFALVDALENRSELHTALGDQNHEYWIENPECRTYVRELGLYKARQMTPLLFAAWERFSKEDFKRVLKLVSAITFRHSTVGARNANELEPVYHAAAKALLDGKITEPRGVFDILRPIYIPDDSFKRDFENLEAETSGQSKHLAKFILFRLESDLAGMPRDPDTDPGTIEHILPENPDASWDQYFPYDDRARYVYRLGNLSILEPSLNRQVGNASFAGKSASYAESSYRLSKDVAESGAEEWTPARLIARQRKMAERAVHLWRSDFA